MWRFDPRSPYGGRWFWDDAFWSVPPPPSPAWRLQAPASVVGAPAPAGALTPEEKQEQADLISQFWSGVKAVTPTLVIVGIATGAAFAIGSGLVSRYVWPDK